MKNVNRILIMILLLILLPVFVSATNYYISTIGNDNNPGTSTNQPWRTIGKVNSEMNRFRPGDNILFKRGDKWSDARLFITCSGSDEGYITFGDYGTGTKPTINHPNGPVRLSTGGISHIKVKNIRADQGYGVYIGADGLSNIILDGLELIDMTGNAIFCKQIDTYTIRNCKITNAGVGGITIYGSPTYAIQNGLIENNIINRAGTDCINIHPDDSGNPTGPNHIISNCEFFGGGEDGIDLKDGKGVTVKNCITHDNNGLGIITGSGSRDITIDKFYSHDDSGGVFLNSDGSGSTIKLQNSKVVNAKNNPALYVKTKAYVYHNTFVQGDDSTDNMI